MPCIIFTYSQLKRLFCCLLLYIILTTKISNIFILTVRIITFIANYGCCMVATVLLSLCPLLISLSDRNTVKPVLNSHSLNKSNEP